MCVGGGDNNKISSLMTTLLFSFLILCGRRRFLHVIFFFLKQACCWVRSGVIIWKNVRGCDLPADGRVLVCGSVLEDLCFLGLL